MQRSERKMKICITLLVLNLAFIWGNSLLPGSVSAAFSGWVKNLLEHFFPISPGQPEAGHGLLRKLAHFTEFACLGIWLCWLFSMLKKKLWLPFLCGFLAACADETIQYFVPDRGPGFRDVLIDSAGAALGILLLKLGACQYQKLKRILEDTHE